MPEIRRGDVYVDTEKLRRLADDFSRWVDDLDEIIPGLESMKFTPGSVPYAFHLRERFKAYVKTGYTGSLANLRESFLQIAAELPLIAKGYVDAETAVTSDVERLSRLLDAAKKPFDPTPAPTPPANSDQPGTE